MLNVARVILRGLTPIPSYGDLLLGGVGWVPFGKEGLYLAERYEFEVDDPGCPLIVEVHVVASDGQPRCAELRCRQRAGGPPVTGEALRRVPLGRYLRESAELYSARLVVYSDGGKSAGATGTGDELAVERATTRSRRPMTDDLRREVARIYNEAESKPTDAVKRHFIVSRPQASRYVQEARRRGLIPPVKDGRTRPRKERSDDPVASNSRTFVLADAQLLGDIREPNREPRPAL